MNIEKYKRMAKKKENENYRLRSFLKTRDVKEVDKIFREAHSYVFSKIKCSECMNCCKVYNLSITGDEAKRISKHSGIILSQLKALGEYDEESNCYNIKRKPCMFLKDNKCSIEECKPESCIGYPGTNRGSVRKMRIYNVKSIFPAYTKGLQTFYIFNGLCNSLVSNSFKLKVYSPNIFICSHPKGDI